MKVDCVFEIQKYHTLYLHFKQSCTEDGGESFWYPNSFPYEQYYCRCNDFVHIA